MRTQDGLLYDLQATGDYYLVLGDNGLVVQARQTPAAGSPVISGNSAVAIGLGSHRLNVAGYPLRASLDGVPIALSTTEPFPLPNGDVLTSTGVTIVVKRASGDMVTVDTVAYSPMLDIKISASGFFQGLLGGGDGDPKNDLIVRNGQALSYPPSYADLVGTFAKSWLVPPGESLFDDVAPPLPVGEEGLADSSCTVKGDGKEVHQPEWPSPGIGTCATTKGFTVKDAAALCGGPVKFFNYTCSDTPAKPPYKDDQISWTTYYACCTSSFPPASGEVLALPAAPGYHAPDHPFTVEELDADVRKEAEHICEAEGITDRGLLDACTLDVGFLGDSQLAKIYNDMPAPRLVLVPLDVKAPEYINPGNAEPVNEQACSIGRTDRATPWTWLFALATTAFGRRLVNRRRRL